MPEPIGPTRVVTFYSYKGGVGRTMALVNTAHVLALEGWRVLLVDFDLEAPGMTHFFAKDIRRRPPYVQKDSLDLLLDAKRSLIEADRRGENPHYPQSLAEYVVPLSLPKAWQEDAPKGIPYRNGRLNLIPATLVSRRPGGVPLEKPPLDYLERLSNLDLASLYEPGGPGHRFGDHVRKHFVTARFEAPGDILFTLRDPVMAAYDVVLIDARTGLNEIAGFSIGTVADALVVCCGLNQQSIEGTRYFMEKAGLFRRRKAKPILVAVGPIPPWLTPEVDKRLEAMRRTLRLRKVTDELLDFEGFADRLEGAEAVPIPYHPLAAIREIVFVTELPSDAITQAYFKLTRRIRFRLLRGVDETSYQQLYPLDSKLLERFCESTARSVPEMRRRTSRSSILTEGLPIPAFPTACGVVSLPERWREIRWENLGPIPIAAAVSALHEGSSAPYERAWDIQSALRKEGYRRFLARCLVYFQSSTPYPPPKEALAWFTNSPEVDLSAEQMTLSDLCAYVTGRKLLSYSAGGFKGEVETRAALNGAMAKLLSSSKHFTTILRWNSGGYSPREAGSQLLRSVEKVADGALREDLEAQSFLTQFYQLPAMPAEIFRGEVKSPTLRDSTIRMAFDRTAYSDTPVGFWPEPLAATALAAARGAEAIDEILAWIHLARLHYGYAWRVLLDWRYFDEVKQHPRFEAFVSEEDEIVASIEGRIDRGDFPL